MKRIIHTVIWFVSLLLVFVTPVFAQVEAGESARLALSESHTRSLLKPADERLFKLQAFLQKHNSPLLPYAKHFIVAADTYDIPWNLVPAITGVESTFGKRIPTNSYNAYGWGNGTISFTSWEESIHHVTKTLREKYYDRGADTIESIGRRYAPPSTTWSSKVHFFMNQIEEVEPSPVLFKI